jgi:hypothetical protein
MVSSAFVENSYPTSHDADDPLPDKVQSTPDSPFADQPTCPDGVVGVALVSVTVAVHVVHWSASTGLGEHDPLVEVGSRATPTDVEFELGVWVSSPP